MKVRFESIGNKQTNRAANIKRSKRKRKLDPYWFESGLYRWIKAITIYCQRGDGITAVISGYFLIVKGGLVDPMLTIKWTALGGPVPIKIKAYYWNHDKDKFKEFTDYLDTHNIKWL